jgi:hypothetical protein
VTHWSLSTDDAHSLYEKFGFKASTDGRYMRLDRKAGKLTASNASAVFALHAPARATCRCCKFVSVLGPDVVLAVGRLGDWPMPPYKNFSAIPFREDRMAGFDIVMRGREA